MIVGTKYIDRGDLFRHCKTVQMLKDYCEMLVPRVIRHDKRIVDNQRYLVAMYVRDFKSLPYTSRKELYEGLLDGVSITGLANCLYDFDDLIAEVDIEKLALYVGAEK